MFLLDDLLLAPIRGFQFIANQIYQTVDKEFNNESVINQQLVGLQMQLEEGEISEEEFEEQQAELFARLRAIKGRQLELMDQAVHSADSSSITVEALGGDEGDSSPADNGNE